jgi:hypothetical protein
VSTTYICTYNHFLFNDLPAVGKRQLSTTPSTDSLPRSSQRPNYPSTTLITKLPKPVLRKDCSLSESESLGIAVPRAPPPKASNVLKSNATRPRKVFLGAHSLFGSFEPPRFIPHLWLRPTHSLTIRVFLVCLTLLVIPPQYSLAHFSMMLVLARVILPPPSPLAMPLCFYPGGRCQPRPACVPQCIVSRLNRHVLSDDMYRWTEVRGRLVGSSCSSIPLDLTSVMMHGRYVVQY